MLNLLENSNVHIVMEPDEYKETTMPLRHLVKRELIKNVMNVVRYMTRQFSIIIMFSADIVEEPVTLNKY